MALDGYSIYGLALELSSMLEHCKIDKVNQPTKDEFVLTLRKKGFNHKLLINISSNNPRIHFLNENRENPKIPPMFCMLLRKHLSGAIIRNVTTNNFERLINFELLGYDELGYQTKKHLIIELMGKFSNLIVVDAENRIVDCAKRVDFESSTRPLLPNIFYNYPPKQDKKSILEIDDFESFAQPVENSSDLVNSLTGMSPLIASNLYSQDKNILENNLNNFKNYINSGEISCYIINRDGKPHDFSILPFKDSTKQENFSFMLCDFFEKKDKNNSLKSVHKELTKTVKNLINRQKKKLVIQTKELEETKERDVFKNFGDLIISNLYNLSDEKTDFIELINYFDESMPLIKIPLDITLSPKQNSDKYFLKYNKLKTAEIILTKELSKGENDLIYLESVLDNIERTETTKELDEIKNELVEGLYIKKSSKPSKKTAVAEPNKYISSDGFTILSGKNNIQNDNLTLKQSYKTDIWFHTQKIHGSHVVLKTDGREVPEQTLLECAMIAAYNSKSRESSNVPVDYCPIKNVKKPRGAKFGMVIYDVYNTIYITPDEHQIIKMKVK